MARQRWTLALILICLPILATVITAFRVRDLPKAESVKHDVKKQKCEDCDVKVGQKLHSIKTESEKHVSEDFKKVERDKQQKHQKAETKPAHKFDLRSDEDDDDDNGKDILKIKTGFKQEVPASKVKLEASTKKSLKLDDDDDDDDIIPSLLKKPIVVDIKKSDQKPKQDTKSSKVKESSKTVKHDDDDDDGDDEDDKPRVLSKPKVFELKIPDLKPKQDTKRPEFKVTLPKSKEVDDEDDDDEDDDKIKRKAFDVRKPDLKTKQDNKRPEFKLTLPTSKVVDDNDDDDDKSSTYPKTKVQEKKSDHTLKQDTKSTEVTDSASKSNEVDDDDDDDDDDNDDDDDDDDDDEDFYSSTLSSILETFSMLGLKIDPSLEPTPKTHETKKPEHKIKDKKRDDDVDDANEVKEKPKQKLEVASKPSTIKRKSDVKPVTQKVNEAPAIPFFKNIFGGGDDHDTDDDDDDDDDDNDDDDDDDDDDDGNNFALKKIKPKIDIKGNDKIEKKPLELKKELKVKIEQPKKILKEDLNDKSEEKKPEIKPKPEIKKVEPVQKGTKDSKTKEDDHKTDKPVLKEKVKESTEKPVPKKEDKKEKEPKHVEDKTKKEAVKKEHEKDTFKAKSSQVKDDEDSSLEDLKMTEKIVPEHKKKYPIKDTYNMYDLKKDTKSEFVKKSDKTSKEKFNDGPEMSSSTESHLKHVTDALHRRNLLKSEFEDFYAFFPTFAPNFSRIHNPECRRHGQIVLRQLRGTKLWALNMLDATAKIPSGILQGNGIQLGDFDQCLGSRARVQLESGSVVKVQGKYCLARLDVKAEHPELEAPVHLAQAKNLIRSRIDDPGHFVPRFSTLSWGVCVPAACNPEDVEVVIKDAVKHYQHTSGVVVRVKVDEEDCHVEEGDWWEDWSEVPTLLTLSFYGVILLLVLVATLQDFFNRRPEDQGEDADEMAEGNEEEAKVEDKGSKKSEGFLSCFSLYYTIGKLIAPGTDDEISCIHGVRGIATIALLIAHKFLPVAVMPYTNRLRITELVSSALWSWCRAGWMFTDCFLLLSGALTAHRISENDTGAPRRLFSRYLRLTPALLAVVLFYAYIWDNMSSGPMWGTFVTKNAEVCQEGWWWNLLYVQNYFGFEDMCAPQTHQLALDMQLTILGCILVWLMQAKKGLYKILVPGLHVFAAYSRYTTVRDHRLTMLAYHGVSVSQLYRTARLSYTSVLHRSTPYLVGLSLGLALKKPVQHGKFILTIGWLSSIALWCLVWWAGIDAGFLQYRYSALFAAQYASLAPIASALAIAWVIYAVHSSNGFLSRFLCCGPLVLISRLSYAIYLTQFIVYITNVSIVKTSREFTLISMIDAQEIIAILVSSILLTLTFVLPMQNLHKVFSFSSRSSSSGDAKESEDPEQEKEENKEEEVIEVPQMRSRQHLIAHREMLEEIPETEVEYEAQRGNEGLGEILEEEEEDEVGEESVGNNDDDLEIIEEEGGEDEEDEAWLEREHYVRRTSQSREDDHDADEWEWTANGNRNGAQYYRYSR